MIEQIQQLVDSILHTFSEKLSFREGFILIAAIAIGIVGMIAFFMVNDANTRLAIIEQFQGHQFVRPVNECLLYKIRIPRQMNFVLTKVVKNSEGRFLISQTYLTLEDSNLETDCDRLIRVSQLLKDNGDNTN